MTSDPVKYYEKRKVERIDSPEGFPDQKISDLEAGIDKAQKELHIQYNTAITKLLPIRMEEAKSWQILDCLHLSKIGRRFSLTAMISESRGPTFPVISEHVDGGLIDQYNPEKFLDIVSKDFFLAQQVYHNLIDGYFMPRFDHDNPTD